jgi:catechol 2,3-dioxygenase-like lactoylglutathione lyase family enzyme
MEGKMTTTAQLTVGLRELNIHLAEAEKGHDIALLREILHDKLLFRRASGVVVTKEQYLEAVPKRIYDRLDSELIEIDEKDDTALVTVIVRAEGTDGDKPFSGSFRNTRLFVREDGRWLCLTWLNARIGFIETVHHVSLPVTDLERSKEFYREVVGLREIARPPFDFPGAWYQVGDRQLHLIVHSNPTLRGLKGVDSRDIHFAVRVRSFREAKEHLESKGYSANAADTDPKRMKVSPQATAGFPQIYLLDPDRHVIEINAERID